MSNTKAGIASIAEGRSDLLRIDPRKILVKEGWNCRDVDAADTKEHVEQLALSIAEIGVQEPITIYWEDGCAWVTDGHCRLWATMLAIQRGADVKTIPCKGEARYANDADRLFSQIVRNSGKPFSQMENAKVYRRLIDMGWQQTDIAKKAGLSAARISQVLDLLTMPEPIKKLVTNGQISASLATKTLAEHNPQKATEVLHDAVAVAESQGSTKAMPKHIGAESDLRVVRKPRDPNLEKLVKDCFEYASFDEEQLNDDGEPVVVVTFPVEWFEKLRKVLEL
jgi:ParB family transcriptional regulator, chromosome partitioning protein